MEPKALAVAASTLGGGVSKADARLQGSVVCDQSAANKHNVAALRFRASGTSNSSFDYITSISGGDTIELTLKTQTVGGSALNVGCAHIVDIDTPLAKDALNFQTDKALPNGKGYALIADAICSAVRDSALVTARVLNRAIPDVAPFFEPVGTTGRTAFSNS